MMLSMFYGSEIKMELIRSLYLVKEEAILAWKNKNNLKFLKCACKFTENLACDQNVTSKRDEMKNLIKELRKVNPNIDNNIFKSIDNVNLNCVLGTTKNGEYTSFLDSYDK